MLLLISLLWLAANTSLSAQVAVDVSKATWGSDSMCLSSTGQETPKTPHPTCPFENLCLVGQSAGLFHDGLDRTNSIPLAQNNGQILEAEKTSDGCPHQKTTFFLSRAPPHFV
jgi:hypothetical protein